MRLDGAARLLDTLKKFVDDTKMGKKAATEQDAADMQQALDEMCRWADRWGMSFNVAKCKVMHVGHNNPGFECNMGGVTQQETSEEVDIGVTMAKNLISGLQCKKAACTAQTVLAQFTRPFHFRNRHIFVKLYRTYVRPHLEFLVPAWAPSTRENIECLEKVQRRAVGMVSGLVGRDYESRLLELGMVTIEERRHQIDMVQIYKILHGKA